MPGNIRQLGVWGDEEGKYIENDMEVWVLFWFSLSWMPKGGGYVVEKAVKKMKTGERADERPNIKWEPIIRENAISHDAKPNKTFTFRSSICSTLKSNGIFYGPPRLNRAQTHLKISSHPINHPLWFTMHKNSTLKHLPKWGVRRGVGEWENLYTDGEMLI